MNLIKNVATPLQQLFAALAIFALLAMPMGQVFAQEVPAEEPVTQEAPVESPVVPEQEVSEETPAPLAVTEFDLNKKDRHDECDFDMRTVGREDDCNDEGDNDEDCDFVSKNYGDNDDEDCDDNDDEDCDRVDINTWDGSNNDDDDCDNDDEDTVTIVAEKIVCTDEADLPNWGAGGPDITDVTAQNWVNDPANPSCELVPGWEFQWGPQNATNPEDGSATPVLGEADAPWTTFVPTDANGKTTVVLNKDDFEGSDHLWVREVLKDNYLPFTYEPSNSNSNAVSAELYCASDVKNYDNYDRIDGITKGETYHCVAWNVPEVVLGCTDREANNYNEEATAGNPDAEKCTYTAVCQTSANLLSNGSFETDGVTDTNLWQKFSTVTGWAVAKVSDAVATTLELHKGWSGNAAAHGAQYAELDGDQSVRVSQSVATTPGATYELRWAFAPRQGTDVGQNKLSVEVDGSEIDTTGPVAGGAGALLVSDWTMESKQFVAQTANTEIAFKDAGASDSYGTFLDDACLIKISNPKPMCELTIVSDATTMVDNEVDTPAKILSFIHGDWDAKIDGASWIWSSNPVADPVNDTYKTFLKDFNWYGGVQSATLEIAADNSYEFDLNAMNGADATENNFAAADSHNVLGAIVQGENNLAIEVKNWKQTNGTAESNPAGLMYKLTIKGSDPSCEPQEPVDEPLTCNFTSDDYSVSKNQEFTLLWDTDNATEVSISGIEGELALDGTYKTSVTSNTEYVLTASRYVNDEKESITCPLNIGVGSSSHGHGGSSKSKGKVLGESTDTPEGGVAGASTAMPAGAPATGAGGTSPVMVSLPSLHAVLNARALVQKSK